MRDLGPSAQPACFTIVAYHANGQPASSGGEKFLVAVRGASRSRARVIDQQNGTYRVWLG